MLEERKASERMSVIGKECIWKDECGGKRSMGIWKVECSWKVNYMKGWVSKERNLYEKMSVGGKDMRGWATEW